jgi:tRNA(adenine34) deaminase
MSHNPVAHAEIIAIQKAASAIGNWRLDDCTLVVTLEPCAMCAGAIAQARIPKLIFGAWDEKAGAVGSQWDLLRDPRQLHKPEVIAGVMAEECAALLAEFFQEKR